MFPLNKTHVSAKGPNQRHALAAQYGNTARPTNGLFLHQYQAGAGNNYVG